MLTADVAKLPVGAGSIAVKTSPKGRIEAVLRVRKTPSSLWLESIDPAAEPLRKTLEKFVIMDDVTITPRPSDVLTVLGPRAPVLLAGALGREIDLAPHAFLGLGDVLVISDRTLGVPGFELHVPVGLGPEWVQRIASLGATPVSSQATDAVRILAGWPIDGRDLDSDVFPMEVNALDQAISYSKGCYVGQEVVSRAKNLGHVNYRMVGLEIHDGPGAERSPIVLEDESSGQAESSKSIGEVKSVATIGLRTIALAFVHRKVLDGSRVRIGTAHASVVALPFGGA
jgi:folate-binding protein YgfZ